jgi:hypothetical protein
LPQQAEGEVAALAGEGFGIVTDRSRAVGAIDADVAFALAHGPLKRVKDKTDNKEY